MSDYVRLRESPKGGYQYLGAALERIGAKVPYLVENKIARDCEFLHKVRESVGIGGEDKVMVLAEVKVGNSWAVTSVTCWSSKILNLVLANHPDTYKPYAAYLANLKAIREDVKNERATT